jgi:hypothetical protein
MLGLTAFLGRSKPHDHIPDGAVVVSYVRGKTRRRLSDDEIIRMYVEDGTDAESIAFQAGCSGSTVLSIVRAAGHQTRKPGRGAPRKRLIDDAEIIRRYRAGQTGPLLADAAGCTPGTIYRLLRQYGIDVRPSATGSARRNAKAARDG